MAAVAALALCFSYFLYSLTPPATDAATYKLVINKGDGFRDITGRLKSQGLIRSEVGFKIYTIFSGNANLLKPGVYQLSPSWDTQRIVKELVVGPAQDVEVTVLEGATVADINNQLQALGILDRHVKIPQKLEGYLFPDTYRFFPHSSVGEITDKFSENFYKKVFKVDYKILIMASLIEKEIATSRDRFLVSGILWKRLKAGMPLQVDAAICYAKLKSSVGCYPLRRQDFLIDSPYNTYKYYGLPPSPIGNPGLNAILAARHPQDSEYWYYLTDPKTKKTVFAKTLEEQNENRAKYLGL